ncbi:MAG: hypothetical protein FJZ01_16860 [Candidatus Sericytochromatia bacterium]|nr:hypothetical protein [Candidatus Tanganyikabacteria bacterium]
MAIGAILAARAKAAPAKRRDGTPPQEGATEVRLGPLPGRDQYIPSGQRPAQQPQPPARPAQAPTPPVWPNGQPVAQQPPPPGAGTTFVPLGPGFANGVAEAPAEAEKTAREERPLTIAAGMGGIEGKHASVHYNLSDKTAIGGSVGTITEGVTSYTLDMRQYVASEKNWGIYVQPGVHAISSPLGTKAAGSAQLGLEWRTNSGITFNVFGGGAYMQDDKLRPTAGFSIGLSF